MVESQPVPLGTVASDTFGKKMLTKDDYMFESFYRFSKDSSVSHGR